MIVYPSFIAALEGVDVERLSATSGVPAEHLVALAAGGRAPSPSVRRAIGQALDRDPLDLFRCASRLAGGDVDLEPTIAAAPSRCITDPTTLRLIDRQAS